MRRARASGHQSTVESESGRTLAVLLDRVDDGIPSGRSASEAPEIDGLFYVTDGARLRPGEIHPVQIEDSDDYDLHGALAVSY